ncbi:MAG: DNA repair protein rad50 [Bogoriella megaspora]|nr:MAG: DNA repair protein rad50 [Bogoriella megaspora]
MTDQADKLAKSKLQKLSIQGIRSFDNKDSATIQFFTPLTLIVGYNGAGKTTIIECLKYATTGELPPNSKTSGTFIHDPTLCHEKEVLAKLFLSFENTSGTRMVVARRLQVTVKKSTRAQKALEATLKSSRNGEQNIISSRVSELDEIIPQYLGVSTAVLENVIFCHQEDSLWPMSQPGELKKRFDEIFEAQKYAKAVDNIKVMKQKYSVELAQHKIIEGYAKEDKVKGEKAEKRSTELFHEIEALRGQVEKLSTEIKDASKKAEEAFNHAAMFEKTVAELEGKRIEEQAKRENVIRLEESIQQLDETDQELQDMLEKYEERVETLRENKQTQTRQYTELAAELEDSREQKSEKHKEIGTYEAQKQQFERQVEYRESLVKETARRHNIRGFDLDITETQIHEFMDRVSKMARESNTALERARRETQDELQKAQESMNRLNEQKSTLNQSKENSKVQVSINDKKIESLQKDLDKIEMDEGGKAALESSIEHIQQRLGKSKAEFASAQWDEQINTSEAKMRSIDGAKDKLDTELIKSTEQAEDSASLNYVRKELKNREKSLHTMTATHGERLKELVGPDWRPSDIEQDFQSQVQKKAGELKDAETRRDGTAKELEQVDFRLTNARNELKRKSSELKSSEAKVVRATDDEAAEYPKVVDELEKARDTLRKDFTSWDVMEDFYKGALTYQEQKNGCRLCEREFTTTAETNKYLEKVRKMIGKATQKAMKEELETTESDLRDAKEAYPSYQTWKRLSDTDVPALELEVQQLDSRRDALVRKAEEQDEVVGRRQEAKRDIDSFTRTVQNIASYHADIKRFEGELAELSVKQKDAGISRGLDQIQDDLSEIKRQSGSARAALSKLNADKERESSLIRTLESEVRDIKSKLSDAEYQLKDKSRLGGQIDDLKALNNGHRASRNKSDKQLQELVPQLDQAQEKYNDIRRRGDERDSTLRQEASRLSDSLNQLRTASKQINDYTSSGGQQQLSRAARELESIDDKIGQLTQEQKQIISQTKSIEDQLRNTDETKRSIINNLNYRHDLRDLESLRYGIQDLESTNAAADKARYERDASNWQLQRNTLTAEQASMIGQLKSKDDQLQELVIQWQTDFKDAAKKYKEAHVKVETTKAAVEDLGRYGAALDKAIMKYHSLKMEEINRIIDELWRKTYQGTDVDTVLIRSDNETMKGNKSYNYRVCMVKQDAEMDMRGRCSAGQKVLASIIIRLALAECFGVNCGMIALDEPTTNLDRSNITALAASLAEIIRTRRQQSNFQLIVITHDEEFLREMQCSDFCDYYYRVSRDSDQKSIIRRQNISEVI